MLYERERIARTSIPREEDVFDTDCKAPTHPSIDSEPSLQSLKDRETLERRTQSPEGAILTGARRCEHKKDSLRDPYAIESRYKIGGSPKHSKGVFKK